LESATVWPVLSSTSIQGLGCKGVEMKIIFISLSDAAQTLGIAAKTARNWLSAGKFPLPTYRIGGKRLVRIEDIDSFVVNLCGGTPALALDGNIQQPKRAGRPRKK
jgi:predicted DNA-binding transcriptional regulator AlpA